MTSHLSLMAFFAVCVSAVFAALMRDDPTEQIQLAAKLFGGFVLGGIVAGWLLYPLPL